MDTSSLSKRKRCNDLFSRLRGFQDQGICERCRIWFCLSESGAKPRQTQVRRPPPPTLPFDCLSRLRWKQACPLCKEVVQRIGDDVALCRCLKHSDFCITLRKIPSGHDVEWRIFYEEAPKGSIIRNSRAKFKEQHVEPRMVWDDTVASPEFIQNLLGHCHKHHDDCLSDARHYVKYDSYGRLRPIPKLYFIDVEHERIVEGTTRNTYAALSYVWGGASQTVALASNITRLKKKGALRSKSFQLPRLIRDAIDLTYSLGIKNLWVDSLCIVQDDPLKHTILAQMDIVYSRAYVTIAAVDCDSAYSPLPGVRPRSRAHLHPTVKTKHDWFHTKPGFDIDARMENSKYNTRAWTFQEWFLSSQILYLTNTQMFFRCRSGVWAETGPEVNWSSKASKYSWAWKDFDRMALFQENEYRQLVTEYSQKQLTYTEDVLNAFEGVMSFLSSSTGWQFIDGVLLSDLPSELLFMHKSECRRRLGKQGSPCLPSWCWAGWEGRATWWDEREHVFKEVTNRASSPGQSTIKDITLFVTEENLAKVKTQNLPGQYKTRPLRKEAGVSLKPMAGVGCFSSDKQSMTLLQFEARTISAKDFQYSNAEWRGGSQPAEFVLSHDGCQVGRLFSDGVIDPRKSNARFIQITTNTALLVGYHANSHREERLGVAFFASPELFEQCSYENVLLA